MAEAKKRVRKDDYPTTGFGPWRRFRDQAFAAGEFRLDKITENWARHKEKQKESDHGFGRPLCQSYGTRT